MTEAELAMVVETARTIVAAGLDLTGTLRASLAKAGLDKPRHGEPPRCACGEIDMRYYPKRAVAYAWLEQHKDCGKPPKPPAPPRCDKPGHSGLTCAGCAADTTAERDQARVDLDLWRSTAARYARERDLARAAAPLPPPDPTETRALMDLIDQELARIGTLIRHGGAAASRVEMLQRCAGRLRALLEPPAQPAEVTR